MESVNESVGIGLKVQESGTKKERLEELVESIADKKYSGRIVTDFLSATRSCPMTAAEDTFAANADFQSSVGRSPKIVRTAHLGACEECLAWAGEYNYPGVSKKVFWRHGSCRCTVEYRPGNGTSQNAHTKKWTRASETDKIEERKTVGPKTEKAVSGGRITDPDSKYANEWAKSYYEEIRHKSTDCAKIAKRLGLKEQEIQKIKNYLFIDKSLWDDNSQSWRRFHEDAAIAQSWQRLAEGEEILQHDRTLISHELLEMEIKNNNPGISHDDAHRTACQTYNYQDEAEEYYAGLRERNKNK